MMRIQSNCDILCLISVSGLADGFSCCFVFETITNICLRLFPSSSILLNVPFSAVGGTHQLYGVLFCIM